MKPESADSQEARTAGAKAEMTKYDLKQRISLDLTTTNEIQF